MLRQKLAALKEHRLNSDPLPSGSAPYTSSDLFRTQKHKLDGPKAKRWDESFSLECHGRGNSTLKAAARVPNPASIISLGTARPVSEYYPWEKIVLHGVDARYPENGNAFNPVTKMSSAKGDPAFDLGVALSYGYAAGSPQVLRFVTEHVELVHSPPYDDWESCLTCGTTSAIDTVFRMFCNRGDWILTEAHSYSGAVEGAKQLGLKIVSLEMDEEGLLPYELDTKLRNWDDTEGTKPSLLYTIPSGQNPTGVTQSTERRRAIYDVAEKHDLLIVEDDPYYLLQLGDSEVEVESAGKTTLLPEEYLRELPASYLSLDLSGRVIRLDSTSKIIAPGLRCGWMTACSQIVEKFLNYTEFGGAEPSGPSQLMLYKLLDESWGHEGFIHWLIHLSLEYRQRRNMLIAACELHLPHDVCRWNVPTVGMFLWINVDCSKHPWVQFEAHSEGERVSYAQIEDRIFTKAKENGVLVSKGSWFAADKKPAEQVFFRLTFAATSRESLSQGIERFGKTLRTEFMIV